MVTGAGGFIGSYLAKSLATEVEVRAMFHGRALPDPLAQVVTPTKADLTDPVALIDLCRDVSTVFHCAAVVGHSRRDNELMRRVNAEGTKNILDAAINAGVKNFVYVSSCVTVGASDSPGAPLDEESPQTLSRYNLGYVASKTAGETLVLDAARVGKIRGVVVNPSVVYGAGDMLKDSRAPQRAVCAGKMVCYPVGGVSVVAVEDVVDGILGAWRKGRAGERYLLTGENMTIKELFSAIADCAGVRAPWVRIPTSVLRTLGVVGDGANRLGIPFPIDSDSAITATLYYWYTSEKARREFGFQARSARSAIASSVAFNRH